MNRSESGRSNAGSIAYKGKTRRGLALSAAVAAGVLAAHSAGAATLTWDGGDHTFGGTTGGSGTWDSGITSNWSNASTEQVWTDTTGTDTALFGSTAGTVAVSGTVTANKLTFASSGYILSGGQINLAGTGAAIQIISGASFGATINSVLASTGNFSFNNSNGAATAATLTAGNLLSGGTISMGTGAGVFVINPNAVSGATNNGLGSDAVNIGQSAVLTLRNDGAGGAGSSNSEVINYGNNIAAVGASSQLSVGTATTANAATNKTILLGTLNLNLGSAGNFFQVSQGNNYKVVFGAVTLTTSSTISVGTTTGVTFGAVSEAASGKVLGKTGVGTLYLTQAGTYTGGTTITQGTISVSSLTDLGTGTVHLGSSTAGAALAYTGVGETSNLTFDLSGTTNGANIDTTGASGGIVLTHDFTATGAGVKTLTLTGNTSGNVISGAIVNSSSATNVLKSGLGTWTLKGLNTYTGATSITAGTLVADLSTNIAGVINSASNLAITNGTFLVNGASSGASSQTLGNLTVAGPGTSTIATNNNGGSGTTLNLGTITVGGGGANLVIDTSAGGPVTTTSTNGANGILSGGVLYYDGTSDYNFATSTGSGPAFTIGAYTGATPLVASAGSSTASYIQTDSGSTSAGQAVGTLKIVTTSAGTKTLTNTNILTIAAGGLLFTGSSDYTIGGGTLTAGNLSGSYSLLIDQYGTGKLTINSSIGNNGANNVTLVKNGTGTLVLGGTATNQGGSQLNGGITSFTTASNLPGGTITFNGGTLQWGGSSNSADMTVVSGLARAMVFGAGGATFDVQTNNVSLNNTIGNNGIGSFTKLGSGTLTLLSANTYGGGTNVAAGTLKTSGALGTNSVTVANGATLELDTNTTIADTATLTLGATSNFTIGFSTGNEVVNQLIVNGVSIGPGVYTSGSSFSGYTGSFSSNGGGLQVLPEPASLGLIGLAAGGLLARKRRRSPKSM